MGLYFLILLESYCGKFQLTIALIYALLYTIDTRLATISPDVR